LKAEKNLRKKPLALFLGVFLLSLTRGLTASIPFDTGTTEEITRAIDTVVAKKIKDTKTLSALARAVQKEETNIKVRERAAWALGQLEDRKHIDILVKAARHKGLLIRSAALNSLLHMRSRSGLPVYIEIAENDPVLSLRQRAVVALGLLRWEKTITPLVKLSSDPKEEIRGISTLAMAATHSSANDFSEALGEMKVDPSLYVQERAHKALDVIQRKNTLVREHLESTDADIRLFAALYFHFHGTSADSTALKASMDGEPNDEVRYEMGKAIAAIKQRAAEKARKAAAKKAAAQQGQQNKAN
jgi:HEAT repeat protein